GTPPIELRVRGNAPVRHHRSPAILRDDRLSVLQAHAAAHDVPRIRLTTATRALRFQRFAWSPGHVIGDRAQLAAYPLPAAESLDRFDAVRDERAHVDLLDGAHAGTFSGSRIGSGCGSGAYSGSTGAGAGARPGT